MDIEDVNDKIKIKTTQLSVENDPNKKASIQNDIKILKIRLEIEKAKNRIKILQSNSY